ncbi:MAG: PD-(D/E)XK nuclease family protein [Chlorobium sp.]|nr:PD-(D/E)XK nuclease family protein [Chlorobium sp.]
MDYRTAFSNLILDDNFQNLNNILKEKTIFDIMGIQDREVSFTRLLAWLLDPHAGHQMGVFPIKSLLRLCLQTGENKNIGNAVELESLNFLDIKVSCEYFITNEQTEKGRLDIYVESSSQHPILLIEAKIGAEQGPNQLSRYNEWVRRQNQQEQTSVGWKKFTPVLIYLTPEGDDDSATTNNFVPMDFTQLNSWLDTLKPKMKNAQAELLINELYTLNSRTNRAKDDAMIRLKDKIKEDNKESYDVLKGNWLSGCESVVEVYEPALTYIGLRPARQGSLGYDKHISIIKTAAEKLFPAAENSNWTISGGEGSLTLRYKPLQDKLDEMFNTPGYRVNFDCWLDRTKNYLELAVYSVINDKSDMDKETTDPENRQVLVEMLKDICKTVNDKRLEVSVKNNFQVAKINLPREHTDADFAEKQLKVLSTLEEKIDEFLKECSPKETTEEKTI